jgi:rare lipoprotein A
LKFSSLILITALGLPSVAFAQNAGQKESGLAAVYTSRLNGHVTSSGQIYSPDKLTAAHKSLPYGTQVKVTNPKNHRSTTVRINDRGPKQAGRVLDITPAAAHRLGIPRNSMRNVDLEVVSVGNGHTTRQHAK